MSSVSWSQDLKVTALYSGNLSVSIGHSTSATGSYRFWINLQSRYDLEIENDQLGDVLHGIRPLRPLADSLARDETE
jgi:plasmid maintenance system antidote protein VapI